MEQPRGDSNIPKQSDQLQRQEEEIPMKTRQPESQIQFLPIRPQQQQQQIQQQQYHQPSQLHHQYSQQMNIIEQINTQNQQKEKENLNPSINQIDNSMLSKAIIAVPNQPYGKDSQLLVCPNCNKVGMTHVELKVGWGSILIGTLLLITPFFCLFFLPCCMRKFKDAHHYCKECGNKIGRYNFVCD